MTTYTLYKVSGTTPGLNKQVEGFQFLTDESPKPYTLPRQIMNGTIEYTPCKFVVNTTSDNEALNLVLNSKFRDMEAARDTIIPFSGNGVTIISNGIEENRKILNQMPREAKENLAEYLSYKHATTNEGRQHRKTVDAKNFTELKQQYQEMRGDALKTKILTDFKSELTTARDKKDLVAIVERLKNSKEYKVLATGQDRTTQLLGLKTSSVAAFEKMIEEVKKKVESDATSSYRPR
ncbi:multifunctional virulence effector protein DrrA [Legionella gratiana]|uniref:Multifunctional virulence effector protein DrrA n=1 Tax=Legionella gratiana TaxID=45066 RepID=A0A378JD09_9GAMM|nr:hypothetical protein [Legionella gratiana]KTD09084.1 multifunctional virulence effector protein DrrA [Legionella gratiana]STX45703.1 substrate of the Dot/Icm secretion system [Legionella gratiana]